MSAARRRLLSHSNEDLVFSEGQHRAATRALQMHGHAGAVLQPQIAAARSAQTGFARALRVSARKIGDAGELVDRAGRADFRNPATGARNSAQHFEWIGLPLVLQGAVAATPATKSSVIVTLPEGGRPAMLCAVGVFIPPQPAVVSTAAIRMALIGRTAR